MRHTLGMSDKFLKSDVRNARSRNGRRGIRVFLQPRYPTGVRDHFNTTVPDTLTFTLLTPGSTATGLLAPE